MKLYFAKSYNYLRKKHLYIYLKYISISQFKFQMIFQLVRRFHSAPVCRAAESSLLAKLRKKTGYTIANCKKALEMNENDADKVIYLTTIKLYNYFYIFCPVLCMHVTTYL